MSDLFIGWGTQVFLQHMFQVYHIITWLCTFYFFLGLSERDYGEGNYESARSKGRIACLLSIVGMVVSVIVVTIIVILYFVVWDRYYHYLPNRYYGDCTECWIGKCWWWEKTFTCICKHFNDLESWNIFYL